VGIIEQGRMLAVGSVRDIQRGRTGVQTRAWVRARVLGGAGSAANWLAERTDVQELSHDGEMVSFSHGGEEQAHADLLRELILAGFPIAAFGSQAKSLEEVFMQVTEGMVQ
jgi:ABC-2 type transport system ATP-binding protein